MARIRHKKEPAYYEGIGPENGRRVQAEDAFSYACERCLNGSAEEQQAFMELAREASAMEDFSKELIDWFYSGNWIGRTEKGEMDGSDVRSKRTDQSTVRHG